MELRTSDRGITFDVRVQPKASRNEITGRYGAALKIRLKAPPVEGAANKMCLKFLAKTLKVPKTRLEIATGVASRNKTILYRCPRSDQPQEHKRLKKLLQPYVSP